MSLDIYLHYTLPECKKVIKDKLVGKIEDDRYFAERKMKCSWELEAPSSTVPIVVTVTTLALYRQADCRLEFDYKHCTVFGI